MSITDSGVEQKTSQMVTAMDWVKVDREVVGQLERLFSVLEDGGKVSFGVFSDILLDRRFSLPASNKRETLLEYFLLDVMDPVLRLTDQDRSKLRNIQSISLHDYDSATKEILQAQIDAVYRMLFGAYRYLLQLEPELFTTLFTHLAEEDGVKVYERALDHLKQEHDRLRREAALRQSEIVPSSPSCGLPPPPARLMRDAPPNRRA